MDLQGPPRSCLAAVIFAWLSCWPLVGRLLISLFAEWAAGNALRTGIVSLWRLFCATMREGPGSLSGRSWEWSTGSQATASREGRRRGHLKDSGETRTRTRYNIEILHSRLFFFLLLCSNFPFLSRCYSVSMFPAWQEISVCLILTLIVSIASIHIRDLALLFSLFVCLLVLCCLVLSLSFTTAGWYWQLHIFIYIYIFIFVYFSI